MMAPPLVDEEFLDLFGRRHMPRIVRLLLEGSCRLKPMSAHLHAPHRIVLARLRDLQDAGYAVQAEDSTWSLTDRGRRVVIDAFRRFAA